MRAGAFTGHCSMESPCDTKYTLMKNSSLYGLLMNEIVPIVFDNNIFEYLLFFLLSFSSKWHACLQGICV